MATDCEALAKAATQVLRWWSKWPAFIPAPGHPDYQGKEGPEASFRALETALSRLQRRAAKARAGKEAR